MEVNASSLFERIRSLVSDFEAYVNTLESRVERNEPITYPDEVYEMARCEAARRAKRDLRRSTCVEIAFGWEVHLPVPLPGLRWTIDEAAVCGDVPTYTYRYLNGPVRPERVVVNHGGWTFTLREVEDALQFTAVKGDHCVIKRDNGLGKGGWENGSNRVLASSIEAWKEFLELDLLRVE